MSALDDKEVPSVEMWREAVQFMASSLHKQTEVAKESLAKLQGPSSFYDTWIRWQSPSEQQMKRKAIAEELNKFLAAEPV